MNTLKYLGLLLLLIGAIVASSLQLEVALASADMHSFLVWTYITCGLAALPLLAWWYAFVMHMTEQSNSNSF